MPVSTMASVGCQYTSSPRIGYVPPYRQVVVPQSSYHLHPVHSSVVYTADPTAVTSVYGSTVGSRWQGQHAARNVRSMEVVPGQQQTRMQTTQGTTASHSADCVVPTLSTLHHSADIQAQVNARLQELEQVNQINTAGTGDFSIIVQYLSKKVISGNKGGGEIRRFLLPGFCQNS